MSRGTGQPGGAGWEPGQDLDPDGPSADDLARFDPDPHDDSAEAFPDETPWGDPMGSGEAEERAKAKERGIALVVFLLIGSLIGVMVLGSLF